MTQPVLCCDINNAHFCIHCGVINGQIGVENENHEQCYLIVDINVDVFEELFNINNIYYVNCKHKCAIKVNVVYVVTYDMS